MFAEQGYSPKNVARRVTWPSLSVKSPLYHSYEVKRMAIFGIMPPKTAPRPLYKPNAVSRLTISAPVAINPRDLA